MEASIRGLITNFQGNFVPPLQSNKIFTLKQKEGQSLHNFFKHFWRVCNQTIDSPSMKMIDVCMQGLLPREVNLSLNWNPPKTIEELCQVLKEYGQEKDGDNMKVETSLQNQYTSLSENNHMNLSIHTSKNDSLQDQELASFNREEPYQGNFNEDTHNEPKRWCDFHNTCGHWTYEYHDA